jgi:hypothetical protein
VAEEDGNCVFVDAKEDVDGVGVAANGFAAAAAADGDGSGEVSWNF